MVEDPEPSTSSSDVASNKLTCSSDNNAICPLWCLSKEDRVWPWVACDHCEIWYHCECTDISPDMYPDLHANGFALIVFDHGYHEN